MSDHLLVCPHCLALNSITAVQFDNVPECANCDAELLPGEPIDANETTFTAFISHSSLPIVVDFWGAFSSGSHEMAERLVGIANTFKHDAIFLKINSEQEQLLANHFRLTSIPTFILFTLGLEYHRLNGMQSEREFHAWLERYLRIKRKKASPHPSSV